MKESEEAACWGTLAGLRDELAVSIEQARETLWINYLGAALAFVADGWTSHADEVGIDPDDVEQVATLKLWECISTFAKKRDETTSTRDAGWWRPFGAYLQEALRNELVEVIWGGSPKLDRAGSVDNPANVVGGLFVAHSCPAHTGHACDGDDPDRDPATSGECDWCHITKNPSIARLRRAPSVATAADFLRDELTAGPRRAREVLGAAEAAGIETSALRQARKALGVLTERVGGVGRLGHWVLEMPSYLVR